MKTWIQKTLTKSEKVNSGKPVQHEEEALFFSPGTDGSGERPVLKEKIFIKYPDRMEGSGRRRFFISESGLNPFFEIFLWEDNNQKIRIDFHYSVHDNEHLLTWGKNSGFVHLSVNSEGPEVYGSKKTQTVAAQSEFKWLEIREKFVDRMHSTCNIFENKLTTSVNAYREIKDILEFILKTIDEKYNN